MLHVWLRAQHSPLAVWHADTKQWQIVDSWQQLHDIYSSYKTNSSKTLCLYFPTSHILQVDTELNSAQLKQLGNIGKQYLFEETSLTSVEQLSVRQISNANRHYLYALAQSDIETWQQSVGLAGLTIQALLPDFLLLPIPEEGAGQQVVLYQDEYTALLRQSKHQGLAVSYLPLIFERLPQLSEVCVLTAIGPSIVPSTIGAPVADSIDSELSSEQIRAQSIPAITNISVETAALVAEHQLLLTMLSSTPVPIETPERHALNFFVKATNSQLSPYLRVAMMVALSALMLQMATDGVQWYRYSEAATATQTEVAAQYQSWFPDERLNARTKLQTQLQPKLRNDSQAPASHMAVLARISPLIKQSSLQAQALIMQPTALSFTLIAPNRDTLDQFTSTLNAQGLTADLERVNSDEQGQFSGQITVNIVESSAKNNKAASS
ncbi:type II secretion system protein GspL [Psychrobacter sp. CAL346-MNA-CIBAN-0220]|uniref:type II secretion system protein GspL n=1 Tax=Psychrobacter sp. CAL346-MNA-CIBAN-0220 TaxID=3140457 RepID=UPI00331D2A04